MSLYDDLMKSKPIFNSNEEALKTYAQEYEALGQKYGLTGDEFFMHVEYGQKFDLAEDNPIIMEDMDRIRSLSMKLSMIRYLISKAKRDAK